MTKHLRIIEYTDEIVLQLPHGVTTAYEGSWTEKPVPHNFVHVDIDYPSDDETPLQRKGKDLSSELTEKLYAHGIVTQVKVTHPREDRYGTPLASTNFLFFAKALAGDCGFSVTDQQIEGTSEDSKDDSCESYTFTVAIPPGLVAELDQ